MDGMLSVRDCDDILDNLSEFNFYIRNYLENIEKTFDFINNNPLIHSFFESGNFGNDINMRLLLLKREAEEFYESLISSNGLINVTTDAIEEQRNLLNKMMTFEG